jgi:hypothetical protein
MSGQLPVTLTYNTYQLLYIYSVYLLMMGNICPKRVEFEWRNKLRINSVSSWFSLQRLSRCTVSRTENMSVINYSDRKLFLNFVMQSLIFFVLTRFMYLMWKSTLFCEKCRNVSGPLKEGKFLHHLRECSIFRIGSYTWIFFFFCVRFKSLELAELSWKACVDKNFNEIVMPSQRKFAITAFVSYSQSLIFLPIIIYVKHFMTSKPKLINFHVCEFYQTLDTIHFSLKYESDRGKISRKCTFNFARPLADTLCRQFIWKTNLSNSLDKEIFNTKFISSKFLSKF